MKALCEAIDVPYIRFHDIRRTFTTILIDSGANAKVVSKLLGHTNVSTTLNIYTDVYEERQIEVTEMLGNVLKVVEVVKKWSLKKNKRIKPRGISGIMHL